MDRTPGQLLAETLKELGVRQSDLGRHFSKSQGYQLVHKWITSGIGFNNNERNQHAVEDILGLPRGYFANPDHSRLERREAYRARVLEEFLSTDLGKTASEEDVRVLRSIRFLDHILPTSEFYTLTLLNLKHCLTAEQAERALAHNEELRASAKKKRDPDK